MEYIKAFCDKEEAEFEGWIGNDVGGIFWCADIALSFSDILIDINTNQPKGEITKWYSDNLQYPDNAINYKSYTMGLRVSPEPYKHTCSYCKSDNTREIKGFLCNKCNTFDEC